MAPSGPLEALYQRVASLHGGLFRAGLLPRQRLDRFTVSVGALRFGGAGKTPLVQDLARPDDAILTRGYGGRRRGPCTVVGEADDGAPWQRPLTLDGERRSAGGWSAEIGDEAALLAAALPGVVLGIGADRAAAARAVTRRASPRRFLLDDGFSHHRLRRDADLVVIPVVGEGADLRPAAGPRREGEGALTRASGLVLVHDGRGPVDLERAPALAAIRAFAGPVGAVRRRLARVWRWPDGGRGGVDELAGRALFPVCAIGRPEGLEATLGALPDTRIVGGRWFRDHHRFKSAELAAAEVDARAAGADAVVSTIKDAVRLPPDWTPSLPWWIVDAALEWERGRELIEEAVSAP